MILILNGRLYNHSFNALVKILTIQNVDKNGRFSDEAGIWVSVIWMVTVHIILVLKTYSLKYFSLKGKA